MAIEKTKLSLEKYAYQLFMNSWKKGKFQGQRLGQAFYNHFKLDRIVDQEQLKNLYANDGEQAKKLIEEIFNLN